MNTVRYRKGFRVFGAGLHHAWLLARVTLG